MMVTDEDGSLPMRHFNQHLALTMIIAASAFAATAGCADQGDSTVYQQTNLVSNVPGLATCTDTDLQNPWGVATSGFGDLWISDNHAGVATEYTGGFSPDCNGFVEIIRAPAGVKQSSPTGVVSNFN